MKGRAARIGLAAIGLVLTAAVCCFSQAAQYQSVVNQYCVSCHNERSKTAGLMLDKLNFSNVAANADIENAAKGSTSRKLCVSCSQFFTS